LLISDFWNKHQGETCLIIANGPGLRDIPLEFLQSYLSFGTNLIYKLVGFTPTYYTAVDQKVLIPLAKTFETRLPVPKFVPDGFVDYQARPVYYFHQRPGEVWDGNIDGINMLTRPGIAYKSITHVALQLAYYMGFTTMLIVGLDHTDDGMHFYGNGYKLVDLGAIDKGYHTLARAFREAKKPRHIINISTATNTQAFERGEWQEYE